MPAVLVVLVVVAPAKVAVVVVQPTEMTVADRNPARTAAAVVVVLVLAAGTQTVSTKLVTAETVHRLRLAVRLLREPAVEEEEAARSGMSGTERRWEITWNCLRTESG